MSESDDFSHYSKSTFKQADRDTKLNQLFDMIHYLYHETRKQQTRCSTQLERCDKRFRTVERMRWFYPLICFFGGVVGGFLAYLKELSGQ